MKARLTYSPEHYRQRLVEYAKDTIDYQSPNGFIKYKVNKHGNPAVVEEKQGKFILYFREIPDDAFLTSQPKNSAFAPSYLAEIKIEQTIEIKISVFNSTGKSNSRVFIVVIGVLLMLSIIKSKNRVNEFLMLFLPYVVLAYLFIRRERKDFKTLVVTFLNTIAA